MSEPKLKALLAEQSQATPAGRIVRALSQKGSMSAREIVEATGLAKSTVSTALTGLRRDGVVIDNGHDGARAPGAGRPATPVSLNPEAGTCVGLLIGSEHMQLIVADVSHAVLSERQVVLEPDFSPAEAAGIAARMLAEAYAGQNLSRDTVLGVGIALGNPVNPHDGRMLRAGGMPSWAGLDIKATFEPALGHPVLADNESNCSAVAEMMWGAAVGHEDFVLFTLDKGIGGAIVSHGRVITGAAGAAGEFGHMSLDPDGPLCRCGNRGCLEVYAGLRVPLALAEARFGRLVGIDELIALARAGDRGCLRLIEDTAAVAGRGLGLIGAAINPPLVVVSGRLATAGDLLLKPLEESFNRHTLVKPADVGDDAHARFVVGRFLSNDACLGAVGLVLRHLGRETRP
jgi:predicted NBD/HSP70 family sugar kinase/DNA-binding transcriptional ArsR family regulator